MSPDFLDRVLRALFTPVKEQAKFFNKELTKAYDAQDYDKVEFLSTLKEKVNGLE